MKFYFFLKIDRIFNIKNVTYVLLKMFRDANWVTSDFTPFNIFMKFSNDVDDSEKTFMYYFFCQKSRCDE